MSSFFFRRVNAGEVGSRSHVLACFPCTGATTRGCTTHVLRFHRHVRTIAEPRGGFSLRPRNDVVPSYRPLQYAWLSVIASPVSAGLGGGAAHATGCEQPPRMKEPERVSHQSPGLRDKGPRHTLAFKDAVSRTSSVLACGSSLVCPVRRRAHPLCSLRSGGTSPYQKPPCA
jgi:hypothetical protein